MTGVETAYLKEAVGAVVAKGLASVSMAQPQDPVEYLAFFMLHHIQKAELAKQHSQAARILEQQREEWAIARSRREQEASEVIQRQWKAHLKLVEDARERDEELKNIFADIEDGELGSRGASPDDEDGEGGAGNDNGDASDAVEAERNNAFSTFKRTRLFIRALDKKILGAMKLTTPADNYSAMLVLKCVLYLQGAKPKQVAKVSQIRLRWKPYNIMLFLHNYDPCANNAETGLPRKRAINRVRRLLTLIHEDGVKGVSVALHAVFSWLHAVVGYRYARDAVVKARREQGAPLDGPAGDLDEDDEDPEDLPAGERDEDEEGVREQELEAQRQAEEEAAAAAAEGHEQNEDDE
jgi:hypothetical protein